MAQASLPRPADRCRRNRAGHCHRTGPCRGQPAGQRRQGRPGPGSRLRPTGRHAARLARRRPPALWLPPKPPARTPAHSELMRRRCWPGSVPTPPVTVKSCAPTCRARANVTNEQADATHGRLAQHSRVEGQPRYRCQPSTVRRHGAHGRPLSRDPMLAGRRLGLAVASSAEVARQTASLDEQCRGGGADRRDSRTRGSSADCANCPDSSTGTYSDAGRSAHRSPIHSIRRACRICEAVQRHPRSSTTMSLAA